MNFMIYGHLFGEKQTHFLKSPFYLEKNMFYFEILQTCFN